MKMWSPSRTLFFNFRHFYFPILFLFLPTPSQNPVIISLLRLLYAFFLLKYSFLIFLLPFLIDSAYRFLTKLIIFFIDIYNSVVI